MTGFNSKRDAAADKLQEPVDIASIIACREMLDAQPVPARTSVHETLKLAVDGLERILGSFEKDGKVVMKSMIRNELFAEMHLLLKKAKKALAQPAQERNHGT